MSLASEPIRSRQNPAFRRLLEIRNRGSAELALLEGTKLLEEALAASITVTEVAASPRALAAERSREAVARARAKGAVVRVLDERLLGALSEVETSQGIVALAGRPAFDEAALLRGVPLVVVAVGVQNPGNLGGLLRTAEAAGASGAYLTAGTADPFSWKALRGSMGSALRLPHVSGLTWEEVRARLRARGIAIAATVVEGGTPYDEADLGVPLALVLGNEGAGLPEEIVAAADRRLAIPLGGAVESLNVGVAAGVLLFEAARQRRRVTRRRG
jgi:TrmH family RNA methyltransferase